MCEGRGPQDDSGKYRNHCDNCPGFGKCIGDYNEADGSYCDKHYFAGLSGFSCQCKENRGGFVGGDSFGENY
jgi:hypothetical protein